MSQRILVIVACLLVAYGSAVMFSYGHSDDYSTLFNQQQGWFSLLLDWNAASGRPILGWLNHGLYYSVGTVGQLAWLRGMGIFLLGVVAWLLIRRFDRLGLPPAESLLLGLLCVLTPSAAVYAGWAITSIAMLSGILALFAAECSDRGLEPRYGAPRSRFQGSLWVTGAFALLLVSLLIYQPLTPLFLLAVVSSSLFGNRGRYGATYLSKSIVFYLAALVAYYLLFKFLISPQYPDNPALQRGGFDLSPWPTLRFVLVEVVPMIIGGWEYIEGGVRPESFPWSVRLTVTGLALGCLAIFGFWQWYAAAKAPCKVRSLGLAALVLVAAGLSLLPMVVLDQRYAPTRTLFFSYAFILLLSYLALRFATDHHVWPVSMVTGLLVLASVQTGLYFYSHMVSVQARELAVLRKSIESLPARPRDLVYVAPKGWFGPQSYMPTRHEYAIWSSIHKWVPEALVNLVWNEREGLVRGGADELRLRSSKVHLTERHEPLPAIDAPVIDGSALLNELEPIKN